MPSRQKRAFALVLVALLLVTFIPFRSRADEGMFLPDAIASLPWDKLARRGMKLKPTDLYNPNGVSIKDAVVIVDGGTGEFVSPEGLLLTNHHVAFDALVAASTTANNYGQTGYLAKTRAEELPAKGYSVTITQDLKDVTGDILNGITDTMPAQERARAIQTKIQAMEAQGANEDEGIMVRVLPMNEGLSYYRFTYLVLPDVRIVYAPPKNIGFFGGDPDNFEWPRHDGDFTFMRVYTGPNGKPAEYSAANVPYKPKKFLSLSMGGVKEGDIVMPFLIDTLRYQIETLQNAGKNDPALAVKLQSTIFGLSNDLKNYEGSVIAMRRADIVDKKRAEEAVFTQWVNADPARKAKYGEVLPTLAKA
ncbi:MAG: S46 family peptidase, partial [Acidobacteriota bacterium]|nr:S46 family peptidase [Acidobacteriota bacterium]